MPEGPAEPSQASQSAPGISAPAAIISDAILADPAACATELAAKAARLAIIMRRAKNFMRLVIPVFYEWFQWDMFAFR